jgi:hypothetical protein
MSNDDAERAAVGNCGCDTLFFFFDVYTKVSEFRKISDFAKVQNIFGSTRHSPKAMFKKNSRQHNKGKGNFLGFFKPLECR